MLRTRSNKSESSLRLKSTLNYSPAVTIVSIAEKSDKLKLALVFSHLLVNLQKKTVFRTKTNEKQTVVQTDDTFEPRFEIYIF